MIIIINYPTCQRDAHISKNSRSLIEVIYLDIFLFPAHTIITRPVIYKIVRFTNVIDFEISILIIKRLTIDKQFKYLKV